MAKVSINIATGSIQQEEGIIVGIDLGTTNSLIAIVRDADVDREDTNHGGRRRPIALRETDGLTLVPSIIYFDEQGNPVVGNAAKEQLIARPERTIYSAKRLMGKSYHDIAGHAAQLAYRIHDDDTDALVKVQVGDRFYSPIELSSYILRELKHRAEHILKMPVSRAVITVPAYFNDAQRQATRDAGRLAGLDVLRIVNEPTAAALAYGLGTGAASGEKIIAVYDLGGGTFDVSILQLSDGIFEVLATNGNTYLGGDDMDRAIAAHWQAQLCIEDAALSEDKSLTQELRVLAEEAKKQLSNSEHFEGSIAGQAVSLTRSGFEQLIQPLIQQTLDACAASLKDAKLTPNDIQAVVLVGGSTRVPAVKEAVKDFFGQAPYDDLNPDEVVALGAAIQADILAGNNTDMLLLDVTPLSLGIETMGGLMDVLIPRNAKIPTKAGRQYTTQKDGQSGIQIAVYQGERDLVQDNRKLAQFVLSGIPAMPAGLPKVEITFMIDADGILKVSAQELRSGVQTAIEVKPQYGLTDAEVERMLLESLTHAQSDIQTRALVEARTEAAQMIATTEAFIQKHQALLREEEITATREQLAALQASLTGESKDAIQRLTQALNDLSRPYAERVMDVAVGAAMKGKAI